MILIAELPSVAIHQLAQQNPTIMRLLNVLEEDTFQCIYTHL